MRSELEANRAIEKYADTVKRICVIYLKSSSDTDDIFQTVFMKYLLSTKQFESEEHEKAWFIRVTINCCKDFLKSLFRHHEISCKDLADEGSTVSSLNNEVLEAVLSLPDKYKSIVYLYFYEEYSAVEISKILNKNINTIYTRLARAKTLLQNRLGGEEIE